MLKDQKGILYLGSTPIGNLGDMTHRAIEILKTVPLVAAEDTRQSKKLFSHYSITTPLISYFDVIVIVPEGHPIFFIIFS